MNTLTAPGVSDRAARLIAPLPHCKACNLEDISRPELRDLIRDVFAHHRQLFGPTFPHGSEDRKCWEVAMAIRAMRAAGVLRGDAEILGIGAGREATGFWLSQHTRVFMTDLYLDSQGWEHVAASSMLANPAEGAGPFAWRPEGMVVQHMNALDLQYPDESFDAVFSSSSIEHYGGHEAVARAMDEAFRVLRPGGVCSISTELRLEGEDDGDGLPGILLFTEPQLRELLIGDRDWEPLGGEIDLTIGAATRRVVTPFQEAIDDIVSRRPTYSTYPHLVLSQGPWTWTSVHFALRKRA